MSFLADVALWSIVCSAVAGTISVIDGRYRLKIARELKACKEVPPSDDAIKAARNIGSALNHRMYVLNYGAMGKNGKFGQLSTFGLDHNRALVSLLRAFHAVGYEVVVRERSTEDIEENPERTEKYLAKFNPSWYVAVGE